MLFIVLRDHDQQCQTSLDPISYWYMYIAWHIALWDNTSPKLLSAVKHFIKFLWFNITIRALTATNQVVVHMRTNTHATATHTYTSISDTWIKDTCLLKTLVLVPRELPLYNMHKLQSSTQYISAFSYLIQQY